MMFIGDDRMARFIRTVERMQACELNDMDYIVRRMTEDNGDVKYDVEIPDKDIASLLKRPAVLRLEREAIPPPPAAKPENTRPKGRLAASLPKKAADDDTKIWGDVIKRMRKLSLGE